MVDFAIERSNDIEGEIRDLLPAHVEEFNIYAEPFENAIDFARYNQADAAGRMLTVTARDGGALVGYWLGLRFDDPHHQFRGMAAATVIGQAFYVLPAYRAKIARAMFRFAENAAEASGAVLIANSIRVGGKLRSAGFLAAIGYTLAEAIYVKPIGAARDARIGAGTT